MAVCVVCLEHYPNKRYELGYSTCLECGKEVAEKEIRRKARCIAPAYNKGPYMYVASKADAEDAGK